MFSNHPATAIGRRRGRAIGAGALVLGVVSSTAACSVTGSAGSTKEDTLRIVIAEEPSTLEPCEASRSATGTVVRSNVTEPLMEFDAASGELNPLLATEWEQTSPTVWTFTLRKGVAFSDGTPFDAEAAAHSIDRAVNSDLGCHVEGYVFGDDDLTVETPTPNTVTVETPDPDPILPLRLSFVEMVPTSTSDTEMVREPIGTGPYLIDSWEAGQQLNFVANEDYWGEAPAWGGVSYVWRGQGSVRAAMVINDEADVATELGPDDGAGETQVDYATNMTSALRMQVTEPPLDDIRVRQAINYATNRYEITSELEGEAATVATQLVTSEIGGYNDSLEPWPYDPDKARELLAEAEADGVDVSEQIRLAGGTSGDTREREIFQVVQQNLTEVGLNVEIELGDSDFAAALKERPFPEDAGAYMLIVEHGNQAGDAVFTMEQYVLSDGFTSSGGSPALDAQIRAAAALGGTERHAALAEVWAMEPTEVMQYSYLAHLSGSLAVNPRVNFEPDPGTGDEMRLAMITPAK